MGEEVDLGLSLGLRGPSQSHSNPLHSPPQLSLMPAPVAQLSEVSRSPAKSPFLCRGIDVNMALASDRRRTYEGEQDGVCSPNSSASSAVSGGGAGNDKKNGEDAHRRNSSVGDEGELERALSRGMRDEEDGGEGSRSRKLRLSKEQATVLEESFKKHHTLNPRQKRALAKQLNLRPRQVEVWFQNRRARTKLKQTEVDCELLRRCCEGLREENRRLQKEAQELRALKLLSPQHYMHMAPATTLTICPSCERLGSVPSAPNANSAATASSLAAHPPALAGAHDHPQQFPLSRLRPHVLPPSHLLSAHRRLLRSPLPMGAASPPLRERGREMGHHSR